MKPRILIVDDDAAMCDMLCSGLSSGGNDVVTTTDAAEALRMLELEDFDCLITDVRMGSADGVEVCRQAVSLRPQLPVVVITAFGNIRTAIEATRAGAFEFLTKPFELDSIRHVVKRAVQHRSLTKRVQKLERTLRELQDSSGLVGDSRPIVQLKQLIQRVAPTDATVLIQGESGTGKELVARMIHDSSGRGAEPFVALNCAALPEALMESELFGHARGAFTDAKSDRVGLFAQAGAGTIFLDEIGELPLTLQPKLLRVLQERMVRPVGGRADIAVRARVVAATNRDLEQAVSDGRFREDLYYRIQVLHLSVPPLRVRGNDVLLLAQTFTQRFCERMNRDVPQFSREFTTALTKYGWPGNVRELSNCIERAVTLGNPDELVSEDLPERVRMGGASPVPTTDPLEFVTLEEVERRHILQVFHAVGANKSLAARMLGLNRKTLYRKLKDYGVVSDEPL